LSAIGDKASNQDFMSFAIREKFGVFVVADGLGGHQSGEKASRYFCEGLIRKASIYGPCIANAPERNLNDWFNAAIYEMSKTFGGDATASDARTTCAILYINDDLVVTAHCGDSRIYRMNPDRILWRSRDHSFVQQLVEEGRLAEDEMGYHPEQHILLKSICVLRPPQPEINVYPPANPGETFILCSDGFWEYTKHEELLQLAQPSSGKEDLSKQSKLAYLRARGGSDNITVQRIRIVP
ncbi:MAG: PP2C family protein-serine/threonine phosphatase, partial [Gammaproteobacteria bacterium]